MEQLVCKVDCYNESARILLIITLKNVFFKRIMFIQKKKYFITISDRADSWNYRNVKEEIFFFPLGVYTEPQHARVHTLNWSEIFWCLWGSWRLILLCWELTWFALTCSVLPWKMPLIEKCCQLASVWDRTLYSTYSYISFTFRCIVYIENIFDFYHCNFCLTSKVNYPSYQTLSQ